MPNQIEKRIFLLIVTSSKTHRVIGSLELLYNRKHRVVIREATSKDAKIIQELLNTSWFKTYTNVFTVEELSILTTKWHNIDKITNQILGNEYTYLVAEKDNNIVGGCSAYIKENNVLSIEKLHILPEYKGLGIGSKLLDNLLKCFNGITLLKLEVVKLNINAIDFYTKKGFEKVKEMEFVVNGVKVPCYLMEKHL